MTTVKIVISISAFLLFNYRFIDAVKSIEHQGNRTNFNYEHWKLQASKSLRGKIEFNERSKNSRNNYYLIKFFLICPLKFSFEPCYSVADAYFRLYSWISLLEIC